MVCTRYTETCELLQDQPKKKVKISSKGCSLVDFLPAPKQDLSAVPLGKGGSKVCHQEPTPVLTAASIIMAL